MDDIFEKKVGVLTFHMAHNYGAMLQAYALTMAVQKLGYNCEIIDYRFSYIDRWSRIERLSDLVYQHGKLGGILRYLKRVITGYYNKQDSHAKFDAFERKIIPHSKKAYRDKIELIKMPYDAILFGSDQIWNSALTNGIAEEYIGGFECLPGTKKIAYAASCGMSDFQQESKAVYNELLKEFSAIGVREKEFQKNLCARGFQAEWVLDPTLLLSIDDWKRIISKENKLVDGRYLLVYAFDVKDEVFDFARKYAKKKGMKIVTIAYKETEAMYDMDVMTNCGPLEFLSLFANAEHIIAASFHGTVFSIIFHKSFHCVPHPKFRDRTDSLLNMLNLSGHNIESFDKVIDEKVDWTRVDSYLEEYRRKSLNFLKSSIDDIERGFENG